jgi:hypothetical protein
MGVAWVLMAQKESLETFFKNWHKFDDKIIRQAVGGWNANTLITMGRAQFYAPVDKGTLQGSARRVNAKITNQGIQSSFIFGVPYAFRLERGINPVTGKRLNIKTIVNPNARSKYAETAVNENERDFIDDVKKAISRAWRQI